MTDAPASVGPEALILDSVLRSTTDAIVLIDDVDLITGWNPVAEKMLGLSHRQALERAYEDLFPPERRDEMRDLLWTTSPDRARRATTVALRADGTRLIVELTCSAAGGAGEAAERFVIVLRDVTEPLLVRSAAAAVAFEDGPSAALTSFADVLAQILPVDNLTLTVLEGRQARRMASGGPGAGRLPSGETVRLRGNPLESAVKRRRPVVCADTSTGPLPFDEVLARSGVRSYVVLPLFRSGEVVATLNVGFATVEAPTAGVVELLVSLTDSIMPIVLNLVTLEDRDSAIQRLEEVDAMKSEFLALITHEIRTPLAIIGGFADHLRARWGDLSEEQKLEGIEMIHRNGRNLYRLVDEGLQVARIESGEFDYEIRSVDLAEEARRAIVDLTNDGGDRIRLAAKRGLPRVLCDPQRHWEILTNLLSNALKFSPPETPIDVELTRRESMVHVAVRDRGPGIARADLPKLFRKFSRVGSEEQRLVPGSGLGLYISKAMVEAQGGTLHVRSKRGTGSTFTYTLPVADDSPG